MPILAWPAPIIMLALGFRLRRERTRLAARQLFLATITYLPLLLALLALS